ncbi:MAG TPA: ATP-binding protein [Bacteroidales bacterium]|nr:ATP-binding protein [Bacteroidales bacterium]HPR57480.1 ATP-binding protein [Bacteroidales bacterium]HRW96511.1 ATP-binding protein [Bacteroidales bacterium]
METAIISGKGGTGKSSISAAFAILSENVVLADCDVDAANLHILFNPKIEDEKVYVAGKTAVIDYDLCTDCGLCMNYCRFDAIHGINGKIVIEEVSCDGCRLCERVCPVEAITMEENNSSRMYSGSFRGGKMVFGRLAPGEENSGKLVNMVRAKAKEMAKENKIQQIIIDGPPGIGCAVISAISGVDRVIIVTEPSLSGMHDLKRAVEIALKFNLNPWVIINKYDLNIDVTDEIEKYCHHAGLRFAGKLRFDPVMVDAMVNCKSIPEWAPYSDLSKDLKAIWEAIESKSS